MKAFNKMKKPKNKYKRMSIITIERVYGTINLQIIKNGKLVKSGFLGYLEDEDE